MTQTRQAMSLTWERCAPPVGDAVVDDLERKLGVTFPQDFRELMQLCHGGTPVERSDFEYPHPRYGPVGVCLGALLTLDQGDAGSILGTREALSEDDQLPEGLVPFADDGGGDYMCLDYRDRHDAPGVVYWAHERGRHDSVFPLADSFGEFLARLQPPS